MTGSAEMPSAVPRSSPNTRGSNAWPAPNQAGAATPAPAPIKNGKRTPNPLTSSAVRPWRHTDDSWTSSPATSTKSTSATFENPLRASVVGPDSGKRYAAAPGAARPSAVGPSSTPASSSPSTAGWCAHRANPPTVDGQRRATRRPPGAVGQRRPTTGGSWHALLPSRSVSYAEGAPSAATRLADAQLRTHIPWHSRH